MALCEHYSRKSFCYRCSVARASSYIVKIFDWKKYTKIQRVNITDAALTAGIWGTFEAECEKLNEKLLQFI